ncbi:transposase [Bathymodiolus japonicus methanotrophic gill symbiont]|uniref:transposase n=1 Tax=Bathymodiolus japonicus methanotrophic gill symbiont TaxID=113269 RepID=UPI001E588AA9|nr:transposase [Bathymodiolus japonicus methanotrophic gill symbiont]
MQSSRIILASIPWDWLLRVSVVLILKRYGITEGVLAFDESDRARSKSTKRIYKVYKQKHKGSGGYVNGQTIVLLLLVTSSITVPVGFFFYMPDPALKQWDKEDKRLKKSGIAKKDRPIKPERDSAYPTKTEIALGLLKEFKVAHSLIKIKGVLADALYGEKAFMDEAAKESGGSQVISQLRKNQNIEYRGRIRSVESYFNSINKGIDQTAYTVGSLQRKSQMDVLLEFITSLLEFPDPGDKLKELGELIKDVFQLMPSGKHMIGRDLGRLGPTASLKYCSAG